MRYEEVTITPEHAAELLTRTAPNRRIAKERVQEYATDMREGRWRMTGEAVKISIDGELLDGQHRLLACVEADVPFTTLVIFDLDPLVMSVLDTGRARTPGDTLHAQGVMNATCVASVARKVIEYDRDLPVDSAGGKRVTKTEVMAFVEKNQGALEMAARMASRLQKVGAQQTAAGTLFYIASIDHIDLTQMFCERLLANVGLQIGDPEIALLRWLQATGRKDRRMPVHLSAYIRTFNSVLHRTPLTVVKAWSPGKQFPRLGEVSTGAVRRNAHAFVPLVDGVGRRVEGGCAAPGCGREEDDAIHMV